MTKKARFVHWLIIGFCGGLVTGFIVTDLLYPGHTTWVGYCGAALNAFAVFMSATNLLLDRQMR